MTRKAPHIMLVRPPDPYQHAALLSHTRPMNLACLAAAVREQGFGVSIVDFESEPYSAARFHELLGRERPFLVGVSCVTSTIRNGAGICEAVKTFDRDIVTVAGGPHVNSLPAETLAEFPAFDCAVYGEGEATLTELCRSAAAGERDWAFPGLARRKDGVIVRNPPRDLIQDLDMLPFPARDLIDYRVQAGHSSRGFSNRLLSTELFTSRGCPFGCSFCAIQATFGTTVRFRTPESIAEEVRLIVRDGRFRHLVIADDTFTLRPERAFEICRIIRCSGIESWNCDTRVTSVSPDLLREMRASGCRKVAFGVESGSQQVLDRIGKRITIDQVRRAVCWAKEAGIPQIEGNFIIGSDPEETPADVEMTRKLIRELPWTFVSVAIIVPYPGTPVARRMKELGLIAPGAAWDEYVMIGAPPRWRTLHFTPDELLGLQRKLTRDFYLNPAYLAGRLLSIRSFAEVRYWMSAGASFAKWYLSGRL